MEARGFEPLSRDISGRPSTCVVFNLRFAPQAAQRQAACFAISLVELCHRCVMKNRSAYPAVRRRRQARRKKPAGAGRVYLRSQFILVVAS
jgi:hypothetical protein